MDQQCISAANPPQLIIPVQRIIAITRLLHRALHQLLHPGKCLRNASGPARENDVAGVSERARLSAQRRDPLRRICAGRSSWRNARGANNGRIARDLEESVHSAFGLLAFVVVFVRGGVLGDDDDDDDDSISHARYLKDMAAY